jgi:sortase A
MSAMTGRRLWTGVVGLAALVGLGACGDPTATTATLAPTTLAATTTTVTPATMVRTISTSTTPPVPLDTTTTTTAAPETSTTTAPVADDPTAGLPTPQPPPADPDAPEAVHRLGTIEIPKIDVTKDLFEGVTLTTLNRGPGHWPGTALPGQDGNVVVGGHRVSHDKPFRNIDKLVAGDEVVFTTDGGRFVYRVVSSEVVTPDAVWIVNQTPQPTATLFACTPPGSTSHRLVVHLALET